MSSNLTAMSQAVKKIAALMDDKDKSKSLLNAARKLADSTGALLETFQPGHQGNRTVSLFLCNTSRENNGRQAFRRLTVDPVDTNMST